MFKSLKSYKYLIDYKHYLKSLFQGIKEKKSFKDIEIFCLFIGYARSGHSLVGSLLDAHQNIVIAHELKVLKYIKLGFSRCQIFYMLLENSRKFTKQGRKKTIYSYKVANQCQGKHSKLKIIGDKSSGYSTITLFKNPMLLNKLENTIGLKVKLIHIIRNPYDNIATRARGKNINLQNPDSDDIKKAISFYFNQVETIARIKQTRKYDIIDIKHEDFIDSPQNYLKKTCKFLGVNASEIYLNDCAKIVFKQPHKSRYDVDWSDELTELVRENISKYSFLKGYSFDS